MSQIKTITADSLDKTEQYRLLVMSHRMAGALAQDKNNVLNWSLRATATYEHYVLTEWSNGIVILGAETFIDEQGEEVHYYYMKAEESSDD